MDSKRMCATCIMRGTQPSEDGLTHCTQTRYREELCLFENYKFWSPGTPWEELSDEEKKPYWVKAGDLLNGLLECTRAWTAWSYRTMTEDDFSFSWAYENKETVEEIAHALYDFKARQL